MGGFAFQVACLRLVANEPLFGVYAVPVDWPVLKPLKIWKKIFLPLENKKSFTTFNNSLRTAKCFKSIHSSKRDLPLSKTTPLGPDWIRCLQ